MKKNRQGSWLALQSVGLGVFYVAMLAFFLYPVIDAAGYLA